MTNPYATAGLPERSSWTRWPRPPTSRRRDADVVLETVLSNIVEALRRGEKVELRGFGSFRLRHRDARRGRNPKTGGRVDVPPKSLPYFRTGKELKALINQEQTKVLPPPLSK